MANIANITLDSNICREPQVFDQICAHGGLARDIILFAAAQGSPFCRLHLPTFCEQFGYKRQALLKKTNAAQQKELKRIEHEHCKNVIEYTLAMMVHKNLVFKDGYSWNDPRQGKTRFISTTGMQLIRELRITRSRLGTVYQFEVSKSFLNNTRSFYQTFKLSDYLNLRTECGHSWEGGRKLFLRLLWKRQVWKNREDNFAALVRASGQTHTRPWRLATELRAMIDKINQVTTLGMSVNIKLNDEYGEQSYSVICKRHATAEVLE